MRMSELFLLAIGLSMDAFAVSVCKGLAAGCGNLNGAAAVGAWFGGFQARSSGGFWALNLHSTLPR